MKRRSHDFEEIKNIYANWWKMLKDHYELLRTGGWSDDTWERVVKETGEWIVKCKMPFASRMGSMEHEILIWLRDNAG